LSTVFTFKKFKVEQQGASFKIGTDALLLGSIIFSCNAKTALDVGTGTGVISLMVAQNHPNTFIDAIEIDNHNCSLAKLNFSESIFSDRLNVIENDFLNYTFSKKFDLIFSNPPFFIDSLENNDRREANSRHLSRVDLKFFVEKIVESLSDKGLVYLIFPSLNFQMWLDVFLNKKLFLVERIDVLGKPNQIIRTIAAFSTENSTAKQSKLTIRNLNGTYTDEYIQLTKDFHSVNLSSKE
jgi:tRNA1Val (adenine37-N6)-methyltransferase